MFNLATLKIEKRSDSASHSSFVGIRRNEHSGELVFRLPLGFDGFPDSDFNEVKSLFFNMYKTFKKFEQDKKEENEDIYDRKPLSKDNVTLASNGYKFKDKEENDVVLYSKIAIIEKIIELYNDLVISTVDKHINRSEIIDFSKIDKYLDRAVYLPNHTIYIDEMNLPKNTIKLESSNLIELYCFILVEILHELEQKIDSQVIDLSNKFRELHLANDQSIFNEKTFDITIEILKERLDYIDKNTAYKNDDYWVIYEAIETFLYGEMDNNSISDDGIFWGINNFCQIWEDMCNTWAFKNKDFNILYADTNIKVNNKNVSNKKIGGYFLYCQDDFESPFFIELKKIKRYMRPDLVRFYSASKFCNDAVTIKIIKKYKSGASDFKIEKKNNGSDKLYKIFIQRLVQKMKLSHGARHTGENEFYNYNSNIFENVKKDFFEKNSSYIIIDWKYHSDLFFSVCSEKLKNDITKQLCYEFAMISSYYDFPVKSQFVIPSFEKDIKNIGDEVEKKSLYSELNTSGITIFKANFYMIQQAYLDNDY